MDYIVHTHQHADSETHSSANREENPRFQDTFWSVVKIYGSCNKLEDSHWGEILTE